MSGLKALGIEVPHDNVLTDLTPWIPWGERGTVMIDDLRLDRYSGVYVLAHIDGRPRKAPADPMDRRIVYVGEGGFLRRRWRDFERAVGGLGGHSGGNNYRRTYACEAPLENLHVAALPIWLKRAEASPKPAAPSSLTCRLRHHVEQALLWNIYYRSSGATLLNRK